VPVSGYSGKPLVDKLGIRPGLKVYVDQPPSYVDELLAGTAYTTRLPKRADIVLVFVTERSRLERRLPTLVERTVTNGMIWVCWPKKAARKLGHETDLDENVVRELGLAAGVVDVKVCAIDEVWSGLKFVRRLADRTT
jgi:hypothetical protein